MPKDPNGAARARKHYFAHREKCRAASDRWKSKHPEKAAEYAIISRARNKDAARIRRQQPASRARENEASRKWRANNPEKARARDKLDNARRVRNSGASQVIKRKYKARKRGATGAHTHQDIQRLYEQQGRKCGTCRSDISNSSGPTKFHVDHVMPLARGGSNDIDNLQLLCPRCNTRKKDKHPDDWARENGLLFC